MRGRFHRCKSQPVKAGVAQDTCACADTSGPGSSQSAPALAALRRPNLEGAIVGKALYEGTTPLAELRAAAAG